VKDCPRTACKHYTPDHYCSRPETFDHNGKPGLARQVFFVVQRHGNGSPGCGGRLFEPMESPFMGNEGEK